MKNYGSVTDDGGQTYKTVVIGTQTWMAENLNYNASGSKCYQNDPDNCNKYGRLYDWWTAKIVCPSGWRLPSDADWNVLMKFVNPSCSDNSRCAGAGTKLKATSGWNSNGNGQDTYGFSALPGGGDHSGASSFHGVGINGIWWSSACDYFCNPYFRSMYYDHDDSEYGIYVQNFLFSVRCVKD